MEKVEMYRSNSGGIYETEKECIEADKHEAIYSLVYGSFILLEDEYDRISEDGVAHFVMENFEKIKAIMEA